MSALGCFKLLIISYCAAGGVEMQYFPARSLPRDPAARFKALFERKPCWQKQELHPYLAGIKVSNATQLAVGSRG